MNAEDLFYKKILKPIIYKSPLGKNSIDGTADTGFNFDYMYNNIASGDTALGRLVDRVLLNLPAVKATRNRKESIKKILRAELHDSLRAGRQLQVLDVASGPARYLVELGAEEGGGFRALCLDSDERSLDHGRKLAGQFGVSHLIEYRRVNIFNARELEALTVKPDIIIASGLYVYHNDTTVRKSLESLAGLLEPGKKILVDNQVANPSKKLMEKICTTTTGASWKLYYRREDEMADLLSSFFEQEHASLDKWRIYHLSVGRRIEDSPR